MCFIAQMTMVSWYLPYGLDKESAFCFFYGDAVLVRQALASPCFLEHSWVREKEMSPQVVPFSQVPFVCVLWIQFTEHSSSDHESCCFCVLTLLRIFSLVNSDVYYIGVLSSSWGSPAAYEMDPKRLAKERVGRYAHPWTQTTMWQRPGRGLRLGGGGKGGQEMEDFCNSVNNKKRETICLQV